MPTIEPVRDEDLAAIVSLERVIQKRPWCLEHFSEIVDLPSGLGFVAVKGRREIVGFAIGWVVADEAELANLGVAHPCRRQGVATDLVEALAAAARERGAERLYLEVRSSNESARALYAKLGFERVGRRPRYYSDPREDAYVMAVDLADRAW